MNKLSGGKLWKPMLLASAAALLLAAAALYLLAERKLAGLALGGLGESFSTRIYAAPFALRGGTAAPPEAVLRRLGRLGYARVPEPAAAGEYSWEEPRLKVALRGFSAPFASQPRLTAELEYGPGGWRMLAPAGEAGILLEPELAAELSGPLKVRRDPAPEGELPGQLVAAVIAAEDKRFFLHSGLDLRALSGALWRNLTRRGLWGGSTITQQLAKNLFLTPRRTLRRKAAEAFLALYLERRYSKNEILALYLNHIYLGQDGPVSVAGVRAAADFYFGKDLGGLDLADCALLAGLIRSPYLYNPRRDPAAALERRDRVLALMEAEGLINHGERAAAAALPLRLAPPRRRPVRDDNAYFTAEVVRRLVRDRGEDEVFRYGLTVHTTLDPDLQAAAARAVEGARHEAALAAMDPGTGAVLALAGGKDYSRSQFNRATQALRQPGSAFKPFVYGAALEAGFTAATLLNDEKRSYGNPGGGSWDPRNYSGVYLGTATLRAALAASLNAATLDLAGRVGPARVNAFARRLGVESPLEDSLAAALGASETGLLELTAAYAPFANGGRRVEPVLIASVQDAAGEPLQPGGWAEVPVLEPALAYIMTSLLRGVVEEGTAASLRRAHGWDRPAAGKTGTTTGGRDAWFVGYTPELLAGVWTGDDSNRPVGVVGAGDALPLWAAFMKAALAGRPVAEFGGPPPGVVRARIDPASGLLAAAGCPDRFEEVFAAGTEPREKCPLHARGLKGWFKRLFGRD